MSAGLRNYVIVHNLADPPKRVRSTALASEGLLKLLYPSGCHLPLSEAATVLELALEG